MGILSALTTTDRVQTLHLQDEVAANATNDETKVEIPRDGTLEELKVWAVPGSEDALQLEPVVRRNPDSDRTRDETIPTYSDGEQFITGEPQDDKYRTSIDVKKGDEIVVIADNSNANNAYRFRVLATVDYAGGTSRILGGL